MLPTLLIVEDERATREGLRSALEDEFEVYTASGISEAMAILKTEPIKLLLTDLRLGGDSGMDLLDAALALPEPPLAIMMTAYGSVDTAVEAMRRGAWHFVTKPLNLDEVEMLLKRALRTRNLETENQQLVQQVKKSHKLDRLIGKSPAIRKVADQWRQYPLRCMARKDQGAHCFREDDGLWIRSRSLRGIPTARVGGSASVLKFSRRCKVPSGP